ncbi:hypothetical protein NQ318_001748, partial [Aromia moschata]
MSVSGFTDILQGPLAQYLQFSAKIGGDVAQHSQMVQQAFSAQLQFLQLASQSGKPANQNDFMNLLGPTSNCINSPAPAPYVKEMNDAGQFYTNRVLKDWKEKNKTHVDWVKAWIQTLTELQAFVKRHHTTGLVWGGKGTAAAAPPPPPAAPLPPPPTMDFSAAPLESEPDRSALFAQLNQGANITSHLKKVTPDMQTHKNPTLKQTGPVSYTSPTELKNTLLSGPQPDKPPTFFRDGKKWLIEYQKGNHQLVVENGEMNNTVYVYKCIDSTVIIKGKINSVVMDSCKKTAVVFDHLVSAVEFINCQSVQMQVFGKVPTISIDKTDGCQIYLSPESLDVEIIREIIGNERINTERQRRL